MISKNFKSFNVNGIAMRFDEKKFNDFFHKYCKLNKIKVNVLENSLGDYVYVTDSAVHQWRFGNNGPSDIETIKKISEFLNLHSFKNLLIEAKELNKVNYSEVQIKSFKKIYDAIIDFLDEFEKTNGFNDLWFEFRNKGVKDPEVFILNYADKLIDKIWLVYKKEYFYLHDTETYNKIGDYINDVLYDTYNGKCSCAYRFEAPIENIDGTRFGITLEEDYEKALSSLNEITDSIILK